MNHNPTCTNCGNALTVDTDDGEVIITSRTPVGDVEMSNWCLACVKDWDRRLT